MRFRSALLITLLAVSFWAQVGCQTSEAASAHDTATERAAPVAASPQPIFFWQATHPGMKGELYLFGSMHMRRKENATLPPEVEEVLGRADIALFELGEGEEDSAALQMETLQRGLLNGPTLDQVVAPETYAAVKIAAAQSGTPMMIIDRMRPWLVAMTLEVSGALQTDMKAEYGVEKMVFAALDARDGRAERAGLETGSEQLDVFANLSDADAEAILLATAKSSSDASAAFLALEAAYAVGDLEQVTGFVSESAANPAVAALQRDMLQNRNVRMVKRLVPYTERGGVVIVTVGCAHFVGEGNVLTLLEAQGYTITRLGPAPTAATAAAPAQRLPLHHEPRATPRGLRTVALSP